MIIINGRFLTQNTTGVQRFAQEIVKELDKIVEKGKVKIIAPKNIIYQNMNLKNIEIEVKGIFIGHLWEQIELPVYTKLNRGMLINLCNTAPIFKNDVITIHDIQTRVHPEFFNRKFACWYNFLNRLNIRRSKKIITVSKFSKDEIIKYYRVPGEKIKVIYNGWQHLISVESNREILKKLKLEEEGYLLAVSSLNPNKNFKYVIKLAKIYPEYKFVIAGKKNIKIFSDEDLEEPANIIWTGYVTDGELKKLYSKAKAFIFPSFYEGFGLPPLEAAACGCKRLIISNKSCLPEVFGNSAEYIDPHMVDTLKIENKEIKSKEELLRKYSWKNSAERIKEIIMEGL